MRHSLLFLAISGWLTAPWVAVASPMAPVVIEKPRVGADHGIHQEQSHLQQASARYSTEIADDEHLPLTLRKPESPKGTGLVQWRW